MSCPYSQLQRSACVNLSRLYRRLAELALLLLFSVPALAPLLTAVPVRSADGLLHLYRLVQLESIWRNGVFFTRWLPDLAYGYGLPLFNYYAPLAYYLTAPLHFLGISFPAALNISLALAMFLGATGTFYFARALLIEFFENPAQSILGAFVAAIAFLYAPYILFNAIHRANLAEQWALALAPFALWRSFVLISKPSPQNWSLAILPFAGVLLAHNITGFLFAPLLLGFIVVTVFSRARTVAQFPRSAALGALSAFVFALALAAFFWLPALAERDFVQIARVIVTPDFDYRYNFVPPAELVALLPPADTGRMNTDWPLTLGVLQVVLSGTAIILLVARLRARRALPLFFLAFAAFGYVGLMLSFSQPIWDNLSLLSFVQLPMRLRGLVALCLAPLAGFALVLVPSKWRLAAALIASASLVLTAFPMLYPRYARDVPANPTLSDMFAYEQRTGAFGTTSFSEYLPIWVKNPPDTTPFAEAYARGQLPDRFVLPTSASICGAGAGVNYQIVCAYDDHPWNVTFRAFYFPGWRVMINRQPVEIEPTPRTGLISFQVTQGEVINVYYQGTGIQHLAEGISIASALVIASVMLLALARGWRSKPETDLSRPGPESKSIGLARDRVSFLLPLLLLALALSAVKFLYTDRMSNPLVAHFDGSQIQGIAQPRRIPFGGQIELLGYDAGPSRIKRGERLDITLYWRALPGMDKNLSTFVHLTAPDGFVLAQQDNLHPANLPTTFWDADAYVADAHPIAISATLAPGVYQLRAGVYDPQTNTRLRGPDGSDYIRLGEIQITDE